MPPHALPSPRCSTTAAASSSGLKTGIQINTQNESSHRAVKWSGNRPPKAARPATSCRSTGIQGFRTPAAGPPVPPCRTHELRDAGEEVDEAHVDLNHSDREVRAHVQLIGAQVESRLCRARKRSSDRASRLGPMAK